MADSELALAALVTPLSALVGVRFWLAVQRFFGLSTRATVTLLSALYVLLPLYGLLGFVANIGLRQKWEVWMVSAFHGMLLGAVQSYARVMFAELVPVGHEAHFFGLYSLTDKGSAWIGPLFTAFLVDLTHEMRWSFAYLAFVMVIPVWLLAGVDVALGKKEATKWLASL